MEGCGRGECGCAVLCDRVTRESRVAHKRAAAHHSCTLVSAAPSSRKCACPTLRHVRAPHGARAACRWRAPPCRVQHAARLRCAPCCTCATSKCEAHAVCSLDHPSLHPQHSSLPRPAHPSRTRPSGPTLGANDEAAPISPPTQRMVMIFTSPGAEGGGGMVEVGLREGGGSVGCRRGRLGAGYGQSNRGSDALRLVGRGKGEEKRTGRVGCDGKTTPGGRKDAQASSVCGWPVFLQVPAGPFRFSNSS